MDSQYFAANTLPASAAVLAGATYAGTETQKTSETAEAAELDDDFSLKIGQFAVAQSQIPRSALD